MKEQDADIRNELEKLRAELSSIRKFVSELLAENKRLHTIIKALQLEIQTLREKEQQRQHDDKNKPPKDSHNSSIPPSQESIAAKELRRTRSLRKKSGKKSGGQPGHKGCTLEWASEPDTIIEHTPCYCQHCGKSLEDIPVTRSRSGQVFDVVLPKVTTTEHHYNEKVCSCGHHNRMDAKNYRVAYGKNIRAIVTYLACSQYMPYGRITEFLSHVFNLKISEGTVRNILKDIGKRADFAYNEIRKRIEKSPVVGADETGIHVNKEKHWNWVFQTDTLTFLFHHMTRGLAAILSQFPNGLPNATLVTDRHVSYSKMNVKTRQVCLAHLLRNGIFLNELDEKQMWSRQFIQCLTDAIAMRKEESVTESKIMELRTKMDKLLNENLSRLDKDFTKLARGISKVKDYIFTFLEDSSVPYDNNASERCIRNVKIKQKVSGCFRTEDGADIFAKIHSIVDTAKKNGNSKFDAILAMYN